MSPTLNNDILLLIVSILAAQSASFTLQGSASFTLQGLKQLYNPFVKNKAKAALLALRCTCLFLAISITPYFFSDITIDRIDRNGWRRLWMVQESALIRDAVRTYKLQPAVVHTAPGKFASEHGLKNISVVLLSRQIQPREYWDDLGGSYHYTPPESTLVAEHEMRQSVKAHWDEQHQFLFPDHGSIAWLARAATNYFWPSTSIGSALNESIFLKVMSDFTNLRELVVGYERLRETYAIIRTVDEDLSLGLGRFLTSSGGARLARLELDQVSLEDLRLLISTMATEPLNDLTPASPAASPPFQLHLSSLTIILIGDVDIKTTQSIAPLLTDLLNYTPHLTKLDVREPHIYTESSGYLSLLDFRPPPLSELEDISLRGLSVDSHAVLGLLRGKENLRKIYLGDLLLADGTWVKVRKMAGLNKKGECGWSRFGYWYDLGYGYGGCSESKRIKMEDERARRMRKV